MKSDVIIPCYDGLVCVCVMCGLPLDIQYEVIRTDRSVTDDSMLQFVCRTSARLHICFVTHGINT